MAEWAAVGGGDDNVYCEKRSGSISKKTGKLILVNRSVRGPTARHCVYTASTASTTVRLAPSTRHSILSQNVLATHTISEALFTINRQLARVVLH